MVLKYGNLSHQTIKCLPILCCYVILNTQKFYFGVPFYMKYTDLPNYYTHTASYSQNSFITIHQIGRNISTPGFSYSNYNNNYVIWVVRKGKGTLETGGKTYNLLQNDVFLTLPNELSIQTANQNDPWELCFIEFSGTYAKELIEKTVFKGGALTANLKSGILANEIIASAVFLNSVAPSEFSLLEFFFKFLSFLDIRRVHPIAIDDEAQNKYVAEIKKYIQTNYLSPIKISDIANKLNINRSHLYRIFKNETGINVEDYIINIRINHAKALLSTTSLSVSAIASAVGYKNYSTFFKRFKGITNLTPNEYRANHKNGQ